MDSFKISKEDEEALQHLSDLLHLFHHRNKNQHRRSIWWRHFQVFRKQMKNVTHDIKDLNNIPLTHLARTKKKAKDQLTLQRIEERLSIWQDVMVPKWQHAFSQLAADGRFAVLGLMLMASLAEACRVLGLTAAFEELGQAEVEKVLEKFGREDWERDDRADDGSAAEGGEDFGEVVSRRILPVMEEEGETESTVKANASLDDTERLRAEPVSTASQPTKKRVKPATEKTNKKKRRKGDAIDDLFSGLTSNISH